MGRVECQPKTFAWGLCCWPSFCLEPSCPSYLSPSSFSSSTSLSKRCLKIATFSASHPFSPTHTRILVCVFFSVSKAPFSLWPNMKSCVSRSIVSHSLCDPVDCSLPGSSLHGILQARILEWVAIPFCRGSSQPRDRTQVSCIAGRFFTIWATREACDLLHMLFSDDSV